MFWIQKISIVRNKIPDNAKYIATEEFNKLMAQTFGTS